MQYNHLESYEWLGEFTLESYKAENSIENTFSGTLTYTPEQGIRLQLALSTMIPIEKITKVSGLIKGHKKVFLYTQCEEVNTIQPRSPYRTTATLVFTILLFGEELECYPKLTVGFNLLNSWCIEGKVPTIYPEKILDIKYSDTVQLSLEQKAFGTSHYNVGGLFVGIPKEMQEEISTSVASVFEKHENTQEPHTQVEYVFCFETQDTTKPSITVNTIFEEYIGKLRNFLSFCMLEKVCPTCITLFNNEGESIPVLHSLGINPKDYKTTMERYEIPLSLPDVKDSFSKVLKKWGTLSNASYGTIVEVLLDHIYNNSHYILKFPLLYVAIEQWIEYYAPTEQKEKWEEEKNKQTKDCMDEGKKEKTDLDLERIRKEVDGKIKEAKIQWFLETYTYTKEPISIQSYIDCYNRANTLTRLEMLRIDYNTIEENDKEKYIEYFLNEYSNNKTKEAKNQLLAIMHEEEKEKQKEIAKNFITTYMPEYEQTSKNSIIQSFINTVYYEGNNGDIIQKGIQEIFKQCTNENVYETEKLLEEVIKKNPLPNTLFNKLQSCLVYKNKEGKEKTRTITQIRNTIAHHGKKKEYIFEGIINLPNISNINELLFIILVRAIISKFSLPTETKSNVLQKPYLSDIRRWYWKSKP